jgi:hypothetical protein
MLLRFEDEPGVVLITQPAHAWISGQLARHWGNNEFDVLPEEVCLAAELHDIGFLEWDREPELNPKTGLPFSFLEMPAASHLDLWKKGIREMLRFGRYPALLVSMHFTNIARQQWISDEKKTLSKAYLEDQEQLQESIKISLYNDYYYGPLVSEETIVQHQQLVSVLDWISLIICLNTKDEKEIPAVPCRQGCVSMKVTRTSLNGPGYRLRPWPFRVPEVNLVCEGRRLLHGYPDAASLREAIRAAAPITLRFSLRSE